LPILPDRQTTYHLTLNDSPAAANICFKKMGLSHFAGRESQIGCSVQRRKFSAKTPQLLKAK
jgi:hypothetical protein